MFIHEVIKAVVDRASVDNIVDNAILPTVDKKRPLSTKCSSKSSWCWRPATVGHNAYKINTNVHDWNIKSKPFIGQEVRDHKSLTHIVWSWDGNCRRILNRYSCIMNISVRATLQFYSRCWNIHFLINSFINREQEIREFIHILPASFYFQTTSTIHNGTISRVENLTGFVDSCRQSTIKIWRLSTVKNLVDNSLTANII